MIKTVFALALVAVSGTALAQQQDPAAAEATVQAEATVEAEAASDEVQVDVQEAYRFALKAFSKCRQKAQREGGAAAVTSSCGAHRKRMLSAKEAAREKN
jgi:hypothetical protein